MTTNNTYVTDGLCHNAELGTFGHECSKPATWIGWKPYRNDPGKELFGSGYCDHCKEHGYEARKVRMWEKVQP